MMNYWGYGHGNYFSPGFSFFGLIISILPWILIIGLTISLVRHHQYSDKETLDEKTDDQNNNLEIVKRRYAQGEIDKKEYEQLKKDLA